MSSPRWRISRLAATEVTNRPASRLAGRLLSPRAAGRPHLATIRRCSGVLHHERV